MLKPKRPDHANAANLKTAADVIAKPQRGRGRRVCGQLPRTNPGLAPKRARGFHSFATFAATLTIWTRRFSAPNGLPGFLSLVLP